MSISILCPTRKRKDGFYRMIMSALQMSTCPLEFVVAVDDGDQESLDYVLDIDERSDLSISLLNIPKGTIYGDLHNICAEYARYDIMMGAADDIVFRTSDWDKVVLSVFEGLQDKIAYVYPNDGFNGEALGTHGFFHKKWFETLGHLCPPIFTVDYSDNYIMDVARGVGRAIYLKDVLVEHMHWSFHKSAFDNTAREGHIRRLSTDNSAIYQMSKIMIENDIAKLKANIC